VSATDTLVAFSGVRLGAVSQLLSYCAPTMPRVLIPSDNRDFVENWVRAYRMAGYEVVTGSTNFEFRSSSFEIVHFLWPEELCGWKRPSAGTLSRLGSQLTWWAARSTTLFTVNNLYPHGYDGDLAFRALYDLFFHSCSVVTHFTRKSLDLVREEFPSARHERHVITSPFNYDLLLSRQTHRGTCREELGLSAKDFVILLFGALRTKEEVRLVQRAYRLARVVRKRLLGAARYNDVRGGLAARVHRAGWTWWLRLHDAKVRRDYVPDEEVYKLFDSCDVVIVPRVRGLNSGIPSLAMTFGRPVIVPSHGTLPAFVAGTKNPIYESGDPKSLASAIEHVATLDRNSLGEANRELAATWTWDGIVSTCLRAVPHAPVATKAVNREPTG
jgi:glycosyltransferase involved in cell wall biosynthesis